MKAAVLTAYGAPESLQLREVEPPTPRAGEVRVQVHATTVTAGDGELRRSDMPWLFRIPLRLWIGILWPRRNSIPGMEVAGVIDALGEGVEGFAVGDAVVAASGMRFGTCAESVCVPVGGLIAKKPDGVPFEAVAPLPIGGMAALGYLRKGGIAAGKTVLVRGASGSIGTYAVQLAKHFGAEVTAVCAPASVDRMRALGADVVLDYTRTDFTDNGQRYDLLLDVVGKMPITRCLRSLNPGGRYVRGTVPGLGEVARALWTNLTSRERVVLGDAGGTSDDLAFLAGLLVQGTLETVIDRRYPLDQIVQAHCYVDTGQKQGHVVITVRADT